jgi:lysozyme
MKLSDKGKNVLILREGKRNKAYLDSKGIPTIGVGHTGPSVYIGLAWTDQQIEDAFTADVKWAEDAVNKYVTVLLQQNQFDALVSWVFNIGETGFRRSTALKLLNEKLYDMVPPAIEMWNKPPEIYPRRRAEAEQFKSGLYVRAL